MQLVLGWKYRQAGHLGKYVIAFSQHVSAVKLTEAMFSSSRSLTSSHFLMLSLNTSMQKQLSARLGSLQKAPCICLLGTEQQGSAHKGGVGESP